jgi:PqqD family protein of HPr-rel-A system
METSDRLKGLALSETGFLFDPVTGLTYTLNRTGVFILQKMREGKSPEEIVKALVENFEVEEDVAREDLTSFLEELKEMGILP